MADALIAGVGPGLGREIALAYAREGADVVLCARKTEQPEEVAGLVRQLGRRAEVVSVDVTDRARCDEAVAVAPDRLGGLHILVNNAFHGGDFSHFADADLNRWRRADDVYAEVAAQTALGYLAPAEEIAGAAVFLASELARPITGQAIGVDAGQWI